MLFVRLDPLFYVLDLFLGESRDLRSRSGEGDNGDLGNLRVQVRYTRRSYPGTCGRVGGREEGRDG